MDVSLELTCNASRTVFLEVSVTQRSGSSVAQGSTFLELPCAGTGQRIVVRVAPSAFGKVFRQGPAVVSADVFGCRAVCGSESDSEVIDVQR